MLSTKRGFIAAAFVAAIMTTFATPAMALPTEIELVLPNIAVPDTGQGVTRAAALRADEQFTLNDVVITVDLAGLAGVATATTSSFGCTSAATTITCTKATFSGLWTSITPDLVFKAAAGASVGASGTFTYTLASANHSTLTKQVKVSVAEGVDLTAVAQPVLEVAPGATVGVPIGVKNSGAKDANGAVVYFYYGGWLTPTKQYSNCFYDDGKLRACSFDTTLVAGKSYKTAEPIGQKADADVEAPGRILLEAIWLTPAEADFPLGDPGTGSPLELVLAEAPAAKMLAQDQVDINPQDNAISYQINTIGDNNPDFAAIGGSGSGAVGSTVTIEVGIKNVGPATHFVEADPEEGRSRLLITVPTGTSLAELPDDCKAMADTEGTVDPVPTRLNALYYECWGPALIEAGKTYTFPVKFHIDTVVADATGSVEESWLEDENPANDKASLVLNSSGGGGGGLPVTGTQVTVIAAVGGLLLIGGALMLIAARRRRTT